MPKDELWQHPSSASYNFCCMVTFLHWLNILALSRCLGMFANLQRAEGFGESVCSHPPTPNTFGAVLNQDMVSSFILAVA